MDIDSSSLGHAQWCVEEIAEEASGFFIYLFLRILLKYFIHIKQNQFSEPHFVALFQNSPPQPWSTLPVPTGTEHAVVTTR